MKKLVIIFFVWAVGLTAQAQEDKSKDIYIIELKGGSVIEAEVNDWVIGDYIDIKTRFKDSLILPVSELVKVVQKSTMRSRYLYQETGYYATAKAQFISGNDGARARHVNGVGVSFSAGKKWSRYLNLGVGVGYDRFIWESGENLVPIFVEYTAFLIPRNTSLFANVQTGYSLAFEDAEYLQIDAKGGFMLYPSLGLRLGTGETKFLLDVGYKFQNAEFTYRDAWSPTTREQRLTYKRLTIRFGILI